MAPLGAMTTVSRRFAAPTFVLRIVGAAGNLLCESFRRGPGLPAPFRWEIPEPGLGGAESARNMAPLLFCAIFGHTLILEVGSTHMCMLLNIDYECFLRTACFVMHSRQRKLWTTHLETETPDGRVGPDGCMFAQPCGFEAVSSHRFGHS